MDLLTYRTAVTLLGASPISKGFLNEILARAPALVAADGGAETAIGAGHMPEAVIGDFDSLSAEARRALPEERLIEVSEQETTDFEKCLARISAPLILGIGFAGRRLDHELAVYNALVRNVHRPCIILGAHDIVFAAPEALRLEVEEGTRISLFPLTEVQGVSSGLLWPIEGLRFAPDGRVGTSNRATGPVEMRFARPGMLVIMPQAALGAAMAALAPGLAGVPAE